MKLRDIIGAVKDKISQSKAALFGDALSLHLAVLRATTHASHMPPEERHINALLLLGNASRATTSVLMQTLIQRLHQTGSSAVALKCLLTIHHIVKRGPFILQDQLSVFHEFGGRNYLNLSAFQDRSSATTWTLSAWVRFYARYLETLLSTSCTLGFYLCSCSCTQEREVNEQRLSSIMNINLVTDVVSLVALIEEICRVPDSILLDHNKLLYEVRSFLCSDYLSAVNQLSLRLNEFNERLNCLSFRDSFELVCALEKLGNCKTKLDELFLIKKSSIETLWTLIGDLRSKLGPGSISSGNRKMISFGMKEKESESARFDDRDKDYADSVRFSSTRYELDKYPFFVLD